jgi:Recombinase
VPNDKEQAVIAWMKSLRAKGVTLQGIADQANARGIRRRCGVKWDHPYVSRLLKRNDEWLKRISGPPALFRMELPENVQNPRENGD